MLCLPGCAEDVGPLEIGVENEDGDFVLLREGEPVQVVLISDFEGIVIALRSLELGTHQVDIRAVIDVSGVPVAESMPNEGRPCADDSCAFRTVRLLSTTASCCYNCAPSIIRARVEREDGRPLAGEVSVVMQRGDACPDPSICCLDESACADELLNLAQVCM